MKVKITAHKNCLIIEAQNPEDAMPGWTPVGPGRIGCVIEDTKTNLGVSKKAIDLLKKVKRSYDDIGDVDWFACENGTKAFAWIGGVNSVKDVTKVEGSRTHSVYVSDCCVIPNKVPKWAKETK